MLHACSACEQSYPDVKYSGVICAFCRVYIILNFWSHVHLYKQRNNLFRCIVTSVPAKYQSRRDDNLYFLPFLVWT